MRFSRTAFGVNGQAVNFAHFKKIVGILGIGVLLGIVAIMIFR